MNYLIDTCVVSDLFKKIPLVIKNFEKLSPKQIHISSITVMEIEYGLNLHREREMKIRPIWEQLLKYIEVVPFSYASAICTASIRSQLKASGQLIGPFDLLIAGTALANEMTMVTSNLKKFDRVPEIKLEDWRQINSD